MNEVQSFHSSDVKRDGQSLRRALELCIQKTHGNIKRLADEPKSAAWAEDGNYFANREGFFEIGNWTSSFFTGMALLAWRETEDEHFLKQVLRLAPAYREKFFQKHLQTHHDIGFLASLYSVALYTLTGDKEHRKAGIRAAEVLLGRFNPKGNFIRAWGEIGTSEFGDVAIIDALMNLPLLYWASKETGDPRFHECAARHADMVLDCFVRPDDSVFHAFRFDLATGRPVGGENYCGFSPASHWARGTAWAIYGFALSYGYTHEAKYLKTSHRLARKFIANLDEQVVPVWDFKLPKGDEPLRDASAAAVAVCGFQELEKHNVGDAEIIAAKRGLLQKLCSVEYLDLGPACPGVQKKGQIGHGVGRARHAYTSWGDYFLMEALSRESANTFVFW